jgi:tRNA(Ile2) C34 agmatinyltransferase TiaS
MILSVVGTSTECSMDSFGANNSRTYRLLCEDLIHRKQREHHPDADPIWVERTIKVVDRAATKFIHSSFRQHRWMLFSTNSWTDMQVFQKFLSQHRGRRSVIETNQSKRRQSHIPVPRQVRQTGIFGVEDFGGRRSFEIPPRRRSWASVCSDVVQRAGESRREQTYLESHLLLGILRLSGMMEIERMGVTAVFIHVQRRTRTVTPLTEVTTRLIDQ